MFGITGGSGFHMTFANGWTVSVQFGSYNYCASRDMEEDEEEIVVCAREYKCKDAEIAAWKGEEWHQFEHDTVKGYCSADEVAAFITQIAAKEA